MGRTVAHAQAHDQGRATEERTAHGVAPIGRQASRFGQAAEQGTPHAPGLRLEKRPAQRGFTAQLLAYNSNATVGTIALQCQSSHHHARLAPMERQLDCLQSLRVHFVLLVRLECPVA